MSSKKNCIDENDLARHIEDLACRMESQSIAQKKYSHMQRLLSKISTLSDKEFDIAYSTLESMIDNFSNKKVNNEEKPKNNVAKNSLIVNKPEKTI